MGCGGEGRVWSGVWGGRDKSKIFIFLAYPQLQSRDSGNGWDIVCWSRL